MINWMVAHWTFPSKALPHPLYFQLQENWTVFRNKKKQKKKRQVLPENIKKEIAEHAWKYGNPEVRRWASKKYPQFSFKRETFRDWKIKYQKNFESQEEVEFFTVLWQGRPSMVTDELVTKIKAILHNLHVSGRAISRKTVVAVGNGGLSSRCPETLTKNGVSVTLNTKTMKWAWGIWKSLDWGKRRGTRTKRKMNSAFYKELTFTCNRKNANAIFKHSIHNGMILNFDQTLLGFTSPNKATFAKKGARSVPIVNVDDKRQTTGTYSVNISGDFLPVQLIYSGVTDRCHSKVRFPGSFYITHSSTHCSNERIVVDYLKKIIFP